ncbi:endoplasmic reticulum metallopeptidase 1 isoform X3 [Capsicum annuum]|uniref:endoplasmic reticulum metallopeptidase 1 isoform X3 n=1 Tax=Capsicum annuum TaxID=4072 RepID=UPI0007BED99F|nr:endoplasmic reticulum metallopeptidase 1 isoform X3 [Capsicum annuum]
MAWRLRSGDIAGFKILFSLGILYGLISVLVYSIIHMKFITPLPMDAPPDRFSEARAIEHVRVLSEDIGGRQEGRQGLRLAAQYIKTQLEMMKERAQPGIRIEIEETIVNGSFNMFFLRHSISLAYRNHTNIIMRISSVDSGENDSAVLVNGHFDAPPGSPGAASILELARLCVDSGWIPPRPVIFLFNGAEELFMLGSHGFITTHRWNETIGAFIDLEASGTGGFDLVCQSGPGSWPSYVYAQSALYPMANSAAQDLFGIIPGDTDYRMFAQDFGDIPGLDVIFLLGGYFYHTASDTVERLLPGSIQARGDNLFRIIKAFTSSSNLQNAHQRRLRSAVNGSDNERAVFFDYLSWFLIYYSREQAMLLHSLPVVIFFLVPLLLRFPIWGLACCFATFYDFLKGMLCHTFAILLAIAFPVAFAVIRLLFSGQTMNWFSTPYLAFLMFVPCSLAGMLIPRMLWENFPLAQEVSVLKLSKVELVSEARFWGAFGLYSILTLVRTFFSAYLVAGLSGGFLTFVMSAFMLLAWISFRLSMKSFVVGSFRSTACYVIPLVPCLMYAVYFGGFLVAFVIEKMGMTGSLPPPFGYFIPDVIVAAIIGLVTSWSVGPILPVVSHWLTRSPILQFLLHSSVLALALSSQFFPYSADAPKRVIFQHTIWNAGASQVKEVTYDFAVVDSNTLPFVFKHAPEVANVLQIDTELSFDAVEQSHQEDWMGIFPISSLFSRCMKFPAKRSDVLAEYNHFPHLTTNKPQESLNGGSRRIYLEFSLGSLKEVWVAVLNITGSLSSWSFAANVLPAHVKTGNGPPSYICRLSGAGDKNWTFWLEANSSEAIKVDVAVVDQYLTESAAKLKGVFPNWIDVTAFSSFMSTYVF